MKCYNDTNHGPQCCSNVSVASRNFKWGGGGITQRGGGHNPDRGGGGGQNPDRGVGHNPDRGGDNSDRGGA